MITSIGDAKAYGEVFNIAHTKEISIYDLAFLVKEMTESRSEIIFVPFDQAYETGFEDMARRLPDISKIQKLMDYKPTLDLPEMLTLIIAYNRQKLPAIEVLGHPTLVLEGQKMQ